MGLVFGFKVLGTQAAIEGFEALKIISILGLAALAGPLIIGGLFFFLKNTQQNLD